MAKDKNNATRQVVNQWNDNKVVYKGSLEQCLVYIKGKNVYGYSYSKLRLLPII